MILNILFILLIPDININDSHGLVIDNAGLVPSLFQIIAEIKCAGIIDPAFPGLEDRDADFDEVLDGEPVGTGAVGTACGFLHRIHESDPSLRYLRI